MRCYILRDTEVTVLAQVPESVDADSVLIQSIRGLDQKRFPLSRLLAIWNALPGVEPVTRFRDRKAAVKRLWTALEALPIGASGTSKQDRVIAMLQRPNGASIEDLMAATGWQRHSIRGVLSGVVRKKRGLKITTVREGKQLLYRVAS
ncbi:MAG: DUF3489 domain-containing protein [Proteobacteria bacterium]|nr:DUF3489 domain-containing protein [Pseudomonadota bacterium]